MSKHKNYRSCCVKNCDIFFKDKIRDFYKFPKTPEVVKKWMEILGLKSVNYKTRICDRHFTSNDYSLCNRKRNAVPSQYLNIQLETLPEVKTESSFEVYQIQESFVPVPIQIQQPIIIEQPVLPEFIDVPQYTCRICLQDSDQEQAIWIFESTKEEKNLAKLFEFCTGLQIPENDKYPQYVCKICYLKLLEAGKLKKQAIESHFVLKSRLDNVELETKNPLEEGAADKIEESKEVLKISEFQTLEAESEIQTLAESDEDSPIMDDVELIEHLSDSVETTNIIESEIQTETSVKPPKAKKPIKVRKNINLTPGKTFYCDYCEYLVDIGKRHLHIKRHKELDGLKLIKKCEKCLRNIYFQSDFERHNDCIPVFNSYCEPCGFKLENVDAFRKHLKKVHFENNVYRCPKADCNAEETTVIKAYYHVKWHLSPNAIVCDSCGMKFDNLLKFMNHRSRKHRRQSWDRIYRICDICGVKIKHKPNMVRHMKTSHLKIIRFYCDLCPVSLSCSTALRHHKTKEHNIPAPFYCQRCSRPFYTKTDLQNHELKMINCTFRRRYPVNKDAQNFMKKAKPEKCSMCERVFSNQGNMKRHQDIVHKNLRIYSCDYCDKKFGQKSQLETHTHIHTGEKPFPCKFGCDISYSDRSTLSKHIKKMHSEEAAKEAAAKKVKT